MRQLTWIGVLAMGATLAYGKQDPYYVAVATGNGLLRAEEPFKFYVGPDIRKKRIEASTKTIKFSVMEPQKGGAPGQQRYDLAVDGTPLSVTMANGIIVAMSKDGRIVMGEYVINWRQRFALGTFTIRNVSNDERGVRGWGKIVEYKDYAEAKRRAIAEHIHYNIQYRCKPPKAIIANSVVEKGKTGDFSIHWKFDKEGIVFVRDCMVVVVAMKVEKDTDAFSKALDAHIRNAKKEKAATR